jgi:hypothetical protein
MLFPDYTITSSNVSYVYVWGKAMSLGYSQWLAGIDDQIMSISTVGAWMRTLKSGAMSYQTVEIDGHNYKIPK